MRFRKGFGSVIFQENGVRLSANLISSKRYRKNEFSVDLFTKSNKKFSLASKNFYKKKTPSPG